MKKALLVVLGLAVVVIFSSFYLMFFSSMPVKLLAKGLIKAGVQLEEVSGSLNSGLSVKKLTIRNESIDLDVSNLKFRYSGFADLLLRKTVVIEEINSDQFNLFVKKIGKTETITNQNQSTSNLNKNIQKTKAELDKSGLKRFLIKKVSIANTAITLPDQNAVKIELIELVDLDNSIREENLTLKKFLVQSDSFYAVFSEIHVNKNQIEMKQPGKIVVKQKFSTSLKQDIEFSVLVSKADNNYSVTSSGFANQVNFGTSETGEFNLKFSSFRPQDYFQKTPPFSNINVTLTAADTNSLMFGRYKYQGNLEVAGLVFEPKIDAAVPERCCVWSHSKIVNPPPVIRGRRKIPSKPIQVFYSLNWDPGVMITGIVTGLLAGKDVLPSSAPSFSGLSGFALTSSYEKTTEEALASLVFNGRFSSLTEEQKVHVQAMTEWFKSGAIRTQ